MRFGWVGILAVACTASCASPRADSPPAEPERTAIDDLAGRCIARIVDPNGAPVERGSYWLETPHYGSGNSFRNGVVDLGRIGEEGGGTLEVYAVKDASGRRRALGPVSVKLPHPVPSDFTVRLGPDRHIGGRVVDSAGRPVAGARVWARTVSERDREMDFGPSDGRTHGAAVSGEDGVFDISCLGEFEYLLGTTPPETYSPPAEVKARGGARDVAIAVRPGLRARICVEGPKGEPLAGASVSIEDLDTVESVADVTTGPDGLATLPALRERREFLLQVSPPKGAALLRKSVRWAPQAETTIRLAIGMSVAGTIVDENGMPVPRAVYWVSRGDKRPPRRETADDRGKFEVRDVPEGDIAVAPGDFPSHQHTSPGWPSLDDPEAVLALATRIPAGTSGARVQLAADRTLRVQVEGPDDVAFGERNVVLIGPVGSNRWLDEEHHVPVITNDGRTLLFTGLTPDFAYRLFARAEARGLVVWEEDLRPGGSSAATWRAGQDLAGKVVLPGRTELHNVDVRVEIGGLWISTKTTRDGSFRLGALPPVPVDVRVFASVRDGDWCGDFRATPGGDPVELKPGEKPVPATPR